MIGPFGSETRPLNYVKLALSTIHSVENLVRMFVAIRYRTNVITSKIESLKPEFGF